MHATIVTIPPMQWERSRADVAVSTFRNPAGGRKARHCPYCSSFAGLRLQSHRGRLERGLRHAAAWPACGGLCPGIAIGLGLRRTTWRAWDSKQEASGLHRRRCPRPSPADIEFMQGMIMHHAQAVEMTALIPSRTENKEIRILGARISLSQTDEIKFMKRWLVAREAPVDGHAGHAGHG